MDEKLMWLKWARELQAIAQNGLHYADNHYQVDRFNAIKRISIEILSKFSGENYNEIEKIILIQKGDPTPKVDVRGVIFQNDKILLVKEKVDGKWTLPGGWADPNETPSQSVEREVIEEAGLEVKATKLLAVLDRDKQGHFPPHLFHIYKIFFLCEVIKGTPKAGNETLDAQYFRFNDIPELSSARTTRNQLVMLFEKYHNKDNSAVFD